MKKISPDKTNPDLLTTITAETSNGDEFTDSFDYVIVATPIHESNEPRIELEFASSDRLNRLRMQRTNTYFIYGQLKLFDTLPSNKRIELFCVEASLPYRSIATQLPCDYNSKRDGRMFIDTPVKLYKLFSDKELDKSDWTNLFVDGYKLVMFMPWLAYPKYQSRVDFETAPPIILDDPGRSRVMYLNALEWCASCMEMECVAARNLSLLIAKKEGINETTRFFPRRKSMNQLNFTKSCLIFFSLGCLLANFAYLIYTRGFRNFFF